MAGRLAIRVIGEGWSWRTENTGPHQGRESNRKGRHVMAIHTPESTATETVAADAGIAVTGAADAAPLTAPASPATAPDTDPGTDADGRVVAVWAALNAEPGGSATVIGAAAGLSRMATGKILNDFEANGRARREPGVSEGGRGRAADRWFPITPDPVTATATAPTADAEPNGTADASAPASEMQDAAPEAVTAPDTDTADIPDVDTVPAPEAGAAPAAIDSPGPAPADEPTGEEDLIDDEEADGQCSDGADGDLDAATEADASAPVTEPVSEQVADDPAWARAHAELTELLNLFNGVISAKDEGNAVMALGCLEMAMTKVTAAHRAARAALTGTAAAARPASPARPAGGGAGIGGSVRTGGLRDLVHAHLIEFPDKDFTPYEIAKVINRSSGAVANALDRLVNLDEAVLTCERPRRFGLAPTAIPTTAAPDADTDAA
ncbi:hypothetical protein [Nonomuraea sp. NPDC023979]|uniref:hypothetical protein n=1 Tax=Nonomuraea sp. NPDC023979 TaxID=3154796 RepID=UPI0033D8BC54